MSFYVEKIHTLWQCPLLVFAARPKAMPLFTARQLSDNHARPTAMAPLIAVRPHGQSNVG